MCSIKQNLFFNGPPLIPTVFSYLSCTANQQSIIFIDSIAADLTRLHQTSLNTEFSGIILKALDMTSGIKKKWAAPYTWLIAVPRSSNAVFLADD